MVRLVDEVKCDCKEKKRENEWNRDVVVGADGRRKEWKWLLDMGVREKRGEIGAGWRGMSECKGHVGYRLFCAGL